MIPVLLDLIVQLVIKQLRPDNVLLATTATRAHQIWHRQTLPMAESAHPGPIALPEVSHQYHVQQVLTTTYLVRQVVQLVRKDFTVQPIQHTL